MFSKKMFAAVTINTLFLLFFFFQTVNMNEFSEGYKIIKKPHPDKYLKMQQGFNLTTDIDAARISPKVQFVLLNLCVLWIVFQTYSV